VGAPQFNMMPPGDGQALIYMEFIGMDDQPLVREKVTLTADGSKKVYTDSTDAMGKLQMRVPIGENYTMVLAYNANFDHFQFPAHGGSYNARVRYKYAGKQAIERMREERLASQAAYDAYMQLSREEQLKLRDENGHKKLFNLIPIQKADAPFDVKITQNGYVLQEGGAPILTPYYVDGLLISGTSWSNRVLAAVDAETGEHQWAVELEEGGISNIEGDDSVVVCATESCTIYAIAAHTGKLLWSKWLAGYVLSAPCIADGHVYIGYEDRTVAKLAPEKAKDREYAMACMDLRTGAIVWQQWILGEPISSAVADGNNLYFNTFAGYTYVLNRENGAIVAEKQLHGTCAPTVFGGQVCMSQRDAQNTVARERIALFHGTTLELAKASAWQDALYLDADAMRKTKFASNADNISLNTGAAESPLAQNHIWGPRELVGSTSIFTTQSFEGSRPLEWKAKLYVTQGQVLRCLETKAFTQIWEWRYPTSLTDDGGTSMAPPILVNGKIVVACMDGTIRVFDPITGQVVTTYATGEKHRQQPIAAKGNFYAPSVDGKLAVVKTGNPAIDKWYCWGGNPRRTNRGE
jgi:outer membrane protein assembly factor BamB